MNKKLFYIILFGAVLLALSSNVVLARVCTLPDGTSITIADTSPCPITSLSGTIDLITKIFNILFGLMIVAASFTFLYAAFIYVTSEGLSEEARKAKRMLIYAIIALIIAVFAWGIPKVIIGFFS